MESVIVHVVIRDQYRVVVVLVCVAFVLALGACSFVCADTDSGCQSDQTASCCCLCQAPDLMTASAPAVLPYDATTKFVPVTYHVNLREVAAAIFNPPKA